MASNNDDAFIERCCLVLFYVSVVCWIIFSNIQSNMLNSKYEALENEVASLRLKNIHLERQLKKSLESRTEFKDGK